MAGTLLLVCSLGCSSTADDTVNGYKSSYGCVLPRISVYPIIGRGKDLLSRFLMSASPLSSKGWRPFYAGPREEKLYEIRGSLQYKSRARSHGPREAYSKNKQLSGGTWLVLFGWGYGIQDIINRADPDGD